MYVYVYVFRIFNISTFFYGQCTSDFPGQADGSPGLEILGDLHRDPSVKSKVSKKLTLEDKKPFPDPVPRLLRKLKCDLFKLTTPCGDSTDTGRKTAQKKKEKQRKEKEEPPLISDVPGINRLQQHMLGAVGRKQYNRHFLARLIYGAFLDATPVNQNEDFFK